MNSMCQCIVVLLLIIAAAVFITCTNPTVVYLEDINGQINVNGTTLHYTLSVPQSYSADKAAPLILALHYGGDITPYKGREFINVLVKPALQELKAIIVAPTCPSENGWSTAISEITVMALIDSVMERFNIDETRILVTGFSAGANGTWYFAASYPDFFTAAIPVSGYPPASIVIPLANMPLYVIHSTSDEEIPYEDVETIIAQLQTAGLNIEFAPVSGISHYNTSGFISALHRSIPWLTENWGK